MNWVIRNANVFRTWFFTRCDRVLFIPAILIVVLLVRVRRKPTTAVERFILRPGGMGDLVCAQIALESLGVSPREFTWLIESRSEAWALHQGLPFQVIGPNLLRTSWRSNFVINTEQRYGLSQAIALLIKGKEGQLSSFDTVRGACRSSLTVAFDPTGTHQVESFLRLFSASLGIKPESVPSETRPGRRVPGPPSENLVVCLGGTHARSRRISAANWISIIERWAAGRHFSLIAGPNEVDLASVVATYFDAQCEFATRSFGASCKIIASASRVLAIDGGLVHVASFYGTPVDAIFTSGQIRVWRPLAEGSRVFSNFVTCSPCTVYGRTPRCKNGFRCLDNIERVTSVAL